MAKISTLNDHKMAKNGPNDLNFGPGVYFNGFYQILKKKWKILKIGHFLPEKTRFFALFASRFLTRDFPRKVYSSPARWSNWPDFWYKCPHRYLQQSNEGDLANFHFWLRFGVICRPGGIVFCYFCWFLVKTAPLGLQMTPNLSKKWKLAKSPSFDCCKYLWGHVYQKSGQLDQLAGLL